MNTSIPAMDALASPSSLVSHFHPSLLPSSVSSSSTSSSSPSSNRSDCASISCSLTRRRSFPQLAWICTKRQESVFCRGIRPPTIFSLSRNDGVATLSDDSHLQQTSDDEVSIGKGFSSRPAILDIQQIQNILPHRPPFLFVDRVIEYEPGVTILALKNVTINDSFFAGHFPGRPIMPGVLIVEALAQVGGLMFLKPGIGGSQEEFFFAGVDKVRFRKPVVPGDTLLMRMTLVKLQKRFGIAKMEGKAYVCGQLVCEGEFLMYLNNKTNE